MGHFPSSFCPWNGSKRIHFSSANTHTHSWKPIIEISSTISYKLFPFIFIALRASACKTKQKPTMAVTYFIFVSQSSTVVRKISVGSITAKNEFFLVICRCIELNVKETDNHETKEITHRIKTLLLSWNSYWHQQRWVRIMIAILL